MVAVVVGAIWTMAQRTTPDKVFTGVVTGLVAALLFGAALTFSPGSIQNGAPNYTFFIIMLVITTLAAAGNAYRPVAWTREELQFSTIGMGIAGAVVAVFGFALEHGFLGGLLSGFISAQGHKLLLGGIGLDRRRSGRRGRVLGRRLPRLRAAGKGASRERLQSASPSRPPRPRRAG